MSKWFNRPVIASIRSREKQGLIGIEIECEGTNLPHNAFPTPAPWAPHQDGSLRGEACEFVLAEPRQHSTIRNDLGILSRYLAKATLKFSNRTSVHVHINVQQLTLVQLYNLICLYAIFEDALVKFSGDADRDGNLFCLKLRTLKTSCGTSWRASRQRRSSAALMRTAVTRR